MAGGKHRGERSDATRHEGFLRHRGFKWLKIAVVLCIVATAAYFLVDVRPRPSGGTWYGYTLGTISALLIVWLTLIGIRKRAMTPGHWSLKAWVIRAAACGPRSASISISSSASNCA